MKLNTKRTFRFFWKHVKRYKLLAILMMIALVIATCAGMAWVIVFREFFEILTQDASKELIVSGLISTLFLLVVVETIEWIGWRICQFSNDFFQPKIMANIGNECFDYLNQHSHRFFTNNFAGALVKKISRLMRGFEGVADKLYWDMTPLVLKGIIIFAVLFYTSPVLGLIMLVWAVLFVVVNYVATKYKWKYDIASSKADSRLSGALADAITNAENIKLFAALDYENERFGGVTEDWRQKTKKAWRMGSYYEAGQAVFMIILEVVILYAAIRLWENDQIVIADFFLIQAYIFELFHQFWNFGRNLRELYERLADSEEMIEILNTKHEVRDKRGAKDLVVNRAAVEFANVKFSYGKGEQRVLDGLSFKVKPGEKIALIGPSGGGKTTIVKLILRMFDLKGGEILIDGQNISKVKQSSLREHIALVPQDPIMFHRTLMENIRYGRRDATDEEVIAAAKMAHCDEFIQRFPEKYETYVGERGVKLSGGQRQRVAIARAILKNAPILILDEATSSLDSESETLIQDALEKLIKQKTTFIIAHRLSTIMSVDRIFVLDGGEIVEEGRHSELSKKDGLYKKLWDLQVGGYL